MQNLATILLMFQDPKTGAMNYPQIIMLVLIMVVFYFFMIRPQQQKAKQQKQFKESLNKGEKIVTIGGIHGKIIEVKENTFIIEAGNGIKLEIEKSAISLELTKAVQQAGKAGQAPTAPKA
jgi:preprotein translocase subunit YajC